MADAGKFVGRKTELVRKNLHSVQRVMALKLKQLERVQQVAQAKSYVAQQQAQAAAQ